MKCKILLLAFFSIFYCNCTAQTAKEIIEKNIENSGGLTNWKLLNSIILQGKVMLGKDQFPVTIYQQRPNLSKTVMTVNKKETILEGYDGKSGYSMNYALGKLETYRDYIPESFDNDFIDFESKGFEAKILGRDKIGDALCYKVELTKNTNRTIYFFDIKNYMLLREIKLDETLDYSDYRKVGNLIFPFRIDSTQPKNDGDYTLYLTKIETNKVFPSKTFKF